MAIHSLYGGRVTLEFDENAHVYTLKERRCADGSALKIAGVTSILGRLAKPALIPWASNMAADYFFNSATSGFDLEDPEASVTLTIAELKAIKKDARKAYAKKTKGAADVGKLVHAYVEAYFKGDKDPAPPKMKLSPEARAQYDNGVAAFKRFLANNRVEIIASERVLFSERWMYAGTTDITAYINGRKCVADVKTSSGLYVDMSLQIAAYRIALEEEDRETYPWGALIHLNKENGFYSLKMIPRNKQDEDAFLTLRECDELIKRIEKTW
jgi:hypothetical protein